MTPLGVAAVPLLPSREWSRLLSRGGLEPISFGLPYRPRRHPPPPPPLPRLARQKDIPERFPHSH